MRSQAQFDVVANAPADLWSFWNELVACDRDLGSLFRVIVRRAAEVVGEGAMISVVADDHVTMQQAAVHHPDPATSERMGAILGRAGRVGEGLAGTVVARRRPMMLSVDDPADLKRMALPAYRQFHEENPVHALLIVPMVALGETIGVLGVFRSDSAQPYDDDDLAAVEALAERAGLAVADARGQHNDLSPVDFEAIYRHSLDGVLVTHPDGRVLAANPAACEILQRSEHEICALGRSGLVVAEDPRTIEADGVRTRTGRVRAEIPMIRGDGSVFVAHISSTIFAEPEGELRSVVIFRDVSDQAALRDQLQEATASLQRLAEEDELTGLRNRRGFSTAAPQTIAYADREDATVQLIYFDIDNLKQINDEHGHQVGDAVIRAVADAIAGQARVIDVTARIGGDELVALLYGASTDEAASVATRIDAAIATAPGLPSITVTHGIAGRAPHDGRTLDELLQVADERMYARRRAERLSAEEQD